MPSSRQVGRISSSTSRVQSEYSRLQRGDRVDGVRAADRRGRGLGQAEVAHLAGRHQLGHRADGLLDRHLGVDAVLVVEVDVVDAEPLQAGRRRRGARTRAGRRCRGARVLGVAHVAELGGEQDLVAPRPRSPGRRSCSLVHGPYMSAVSRKVMPRSSGAVEGRRSTGRRRAGRRSRTCPCSRVRERRRGASRAERALREGHGVTVARRRDIRKQAPAEPNRPAGRPTGGPARRLAMRARP